LVLGFALVAIDPPIILFFGFLAYAVSGPVLTLTKLRQHKTGRQQDK
jgi:CDP-diacylglycerol--serine O-phosphatidyltransferase